MSTATQNVVNKARKSNNICFSVLAWSEVARLAS